MNSDPKPPSVTEPPPLSCARIAGLIGVMMLVCGSFTRHVGSKLIILSDSVTTASNILAAESLFRLGIVSSLLMITAWMLYVLILYRLLKPVNKTHAMIMIILVLVCVPIFMLNQLHQYAALPLAAAQMHDQMILFLNLHKHGNVISAIFFGLWLFPLGLLVFKSGYFPRILGLLLMTGCFGYLILFFQTFLFPGSEGTLWSNPALIISHISELSLMLWLLIKGVDMKQWEKQAANAT